MVETRRILILDGYTDEPGNLGVPPYLSYDARYAAGVAWSQGADLEYITVDQWRKDRALPEADLMILIAGCVVPGKYLRAEPITDAEIRDVVSLFRRPILGGGAKFRFSFTRLGRPNLFVTHGHIDATLDHYLRTGEWDHARRNPEQWHRWSLAGVPLIELHPDYPDPLMVEMDVYEGCVRYFNGGCRFCIEPKKGRPQMRTPEQVSEEYGKLSDLGAVNFRLGGMTDIFSYYPETLGDSDTPRPRPEMIEKLLGGIHARGAPAVLHLDNANPAIMANHPEQTREILELLVKYCTPGNVLSLGLESTDPAVHEKMNLNARPEQVRDAVEMVNEIGGHRGANGMPHLLPGLNFIYGLQGESATTYELNMEFLRGLLDSGLRLRRINIRQVLMPVGGLKPSRKRFQKWKQSCRETIDRPMLEKVIPAGTRLTDVFLEKFDNNVTWGRQVASYPILVGIPYETVLDRYVNVVITEHGFRSITGVVAPIDLNEASLKELEAIPGVGPATARRITEHRPYLDMAEAAEMANVDKSVLLPFV